MNAPKHLDFISNPRQRAMAELVCAGIGYGDAEKIVKHARRIARSAELACNVGLTDDQRHQEAVDRVMIDQTLADYGLTATYSGDPRGYVVKVQFPGGESNTWGNDGWGIA